MTPAAAPNAGPRRKWGRRLLLACAGLAVLYGVLGALALPLLVQKIGAEKLGEMLGRVVAIDKVAINPFTLTATISGVRVMEPDRSTPFASFERLHLDASIASAWNLAPIFDALALDGLRVAVIRDGDNHYNFSDIVDRLVAQSAAPAAKQSAQEKSRFSFSNIRVSGARVDFDDRPNGSRHQITDVNLTVPFVSNLPVHLREFVEPAFSATIDGAPFKLSGETKPFENSLETHLALNIDALDTRKYLKYLPLSLPVQIDSALVDAQLRCVFTQWQKREPTAHITGHIAIREAGMSTAVDRPLATLARLDIDIGMIDLIDRTLNLKTVRLRELNVRKDQWRTPQLDVNAVSLDLARRQVVVGEIVSPHGSLALKRRRDGSLELPTFDARAANSAPPTAADDKSAHSGTPPRKEDEPAPWEASLKKVALADFNIALTDAGVKPVATHRVAIAHLDIENISTEKNARAAARAQLAINKGGHLAVESTIGFSPLAVTAHIDARQIDLTPLRPYVAQFPDVRLVSAAVTAKGTVSLREQGPGMRVGYKGGAELVNLASVMAANNEELLKWESLRFSGIALDAPPDAPLSLSVAGVVLDHFYSRLVLSAEGKLNVQELMPAAQPAIAAAGAPSAAAPSPAAAPLTPAGAEAPANRVRIDKVEFRNGRLNYSDHFIRPNFSVDLDDVNGSISGLSSENDSRALVDIRGSYDHRAPVTIAGSVNPLGGNLFLDIKATGKDIELPALSAYSERYAGYGITQGKLLLDVKYHVDNGKLDAQNNILITQLTFGPHVDSPDATKLPVLFAVSLLKNARGEIELNLPISGSLDDPQFSIGALVGRVIVGLLTKAVTAPFALLGAVLGGSGGGGDGDQFAYVEFDYGQSTLSPDNQAKLQKLAKALLDRPALKLEIAAQTDPVQDLDALRNAALQRKLIDARHRSPTVGPSGVAAGRDAPIAPAEYDRLLKLAYEHETFAKPRNALGMAKDLPGPEMEALMRSHLGVGEEALQALAVARAGQVRDYLISHEMLPAERVLVGDSVPLDKAVQKAPGKASRVDFRLK